MSRFEELYPYATKTETRALRAIAKYGSANKASKILGINRSSVDRALKRVRRRAARQNPELHATAAPAGYRLRGVSTLVNSAGNVVQQWVKTAVDKEAQRRELLQAAIEDIVAAGRGRLAPIKPPKQTDNDTLAVYPMADAHIGLLSWEKETGENFDLKIAERTMAETVDRLVASAPPAKRAVFINLGDYLHVDGSSNKTTRGTPQDVDGRFAKVAMAGVRIKRRVIDRLLQRHDEVEVITLAGNHDTNQAVWLAIAMQALYSKEPRVKVSVDPSAFQVLEHGVNLIGAAHGHSSSLDKLPSFLAANWPEEWGRAKHRIWYTGHLHHDSVKEHAGCIVETLRTTAARDAWTHASAYHSGRDLKCDVWHKEHGRIARLIQRAA